MTKLSPENLDPTHPVADQLRALGVKGVLVRMADQGQVLKLKCEMPECHHPVGRGVFDPAKSKPNSWAPSADHYPVLKSAGGKLTPENVRLAHVRCNHLDYVRRTQIGSLLAKGMSLAEIAETLNRKGIQPPRNSSKWTTATVRRAFVS